MTLSPNLALPFLSAAQAQKHITVNEALTRLDGVVQLRLSGIDTNLPPANPAEGSIYAVGATAQDDFAGHAGQLSLFSNGGWDYITPAIGWQGYDVGAREILRFDGVTWQRPQISGAPLGGGVEVRSASLDLVIAPGASATTDPIFPERCIGLGVTGLVTSTLTGTLSTWAIGVADDPLRFGSGISLGVNSWVNGPQAPLVYWSPTALTLTAEGGVFSGGTVRLVAYYIELSLPNWV